MMKKGCGTTTGRKNGLPSAVTPSPANTKKSGAMQGRKGK